MDECERCTSQVLINRAAARVPASKGDFILIHELQVAFFPGILIPTDRDGWFVPPEKKDRPRDITCEQRFFGRKVGENRVQVRPQDIHLGHCDSKIR
jgi:hypothetical protein